MYFIQNRQFPLSGAAACSHFMKFMVTNLDKSAFLEQYKTTENAYLIDVRDPVELITTGHLDGAINIPLNHLFYERIQRLDSSRPAFVYCASGRRSFNAAVVLFNLGFEVYNMTGGIEG